MLEISNEWAKKSGLKEVGVYLEEEWRYHNTKMQKF